MPRKLSSLNTPKIFSFKDNKVPNPKARYVNGNKYKSRYDMLNHVVTEYWVYGEFGEGFGMPKKAFFTTEETDDIRRLRHTGRSENIKWGRSDLKLGKFKFSDFLDCTDISNTTDLQFRLSERIFVYNNTLGPGIGLHHTR